MNNAYVVNSTELQRLGIPKSNVVALRFMLYCPYHNDVEAKITIFRKNGVSININNLKINTPYPNTNVFCVNRKFGNRLSKHFIPVLFDSIEEIRDICRIEVIWKVTESEYYILDYYINDSDLSGDGIYGIEHEFCVDEYVDASATEKNVLNQARLSDRCILSNNKIIDAFDRNFEKILIVSKSAGRNTYDASFEMHVDTEDSSCPNSVVNLLEQNEDKYCVVGYCKFKDELSGDILFM